MSEYTPPIIGTGVQTRSMERISEGRLILPVIGRKLLPYDVAKLQAVEDYDANRNDRLTVEEASVLLQRLHDQFGVSVELYPAFDKGLFLTYVMNGGSLLDNGRGSFSVGSAGVVNYNDVRTVLGSNARRFFRAYASVIRFIVADFLQNYDSTNDKHRRIHSAILRNAVERGLSHNPDLAFDAADACDCLTVGEVEIIKRSRDVVTSNTRPTSKRGTTMTVEEL